MWLFYPTSGTKRKRAETWNLKSSISTPPASPTIRAEAVLLPDAAE